MRLLPAGLRRPDPVLIVIAALLCAAVLVVYLQHRALMALDHQTGLILQKISEQAAAAAAEELRRTFDGPIFDTLTAVNHPDLRAGRLDLVAQHYAEGLERYPQVDRFFIWTEGTAASAPGEVMFYGGRDAPPPPARGAPAIASFYRDPAFGRQVFAIADRYAGSQMIYAAVEHRVGQTLYDVFVRLYWTDASRDRYFAVLGFVVNVSTVRTHLFPELSRRRLADLLNPKDGSPKMDLRVYDDRGQKVFGPPGPRSAIAGRTPLLLEFYPGEDIRARMAAQVPLRRWTLEISPVSRDAPALIASTGTQGYWLSGISVLLMLIALAFTLQGHQRAAQLSRMQADFVSHVSHQLKTPLSLLSAVSETLEMDRVRSPEKLAHYLQIVRTETTRLSALVERVLEFSRVDSHGRTFELESLSLGPLVRETVEAFQRTLPPGEVTITVEDAGDAPIVAADPAAIEQVLLNLLDNAVQYSDRVKHISVRVAAAGADAVIEVSDRGVGIDRTDLTRVFEKFYRGAGSSLHRDGFGLGLAIAQELVRAHRGRIEVTSALGHGSTFRVRLPALDRRRKPASRRVAAAGAVDAARDRTATPSSR